MHRFWVCASHFTMCAWSTTPFPRISTFLKAAGFTSCFPISFVHFQILKHFDHHLSLDFPSIFYMKIPLRSFCNSIFDLVCPLPPPYNFLDHFLWFPRINTRIHPNWHLRFLWSQINFLPQDSSFSSYPMMNTRLPSMWSQISTLQISALFTGFEEGMLCGSMLLLPCCMGSFGNIWYSLFPECQGEFAPPSPVHHCYISI